MSGAVYASLRYEVSGAIARITIDREAKLNALNRATLAELADSLERVAADPAVRCLILTGTGRKAFVAGADIGELKGLDGAAGRAVNERGQRLFRRLETLGKVSIAAVNGYALGGGCELALACSLRIASDNASFGLPELSLGLIPGYGGTQRLSRLIGMGRALELILTGRRLTAQESLAVGLVSQVVPQDELLEAAQTLAQTILQKAPLAVTMALEAVTRGMELPLDGGLALEAALSGVVFGSGDKEEGIAAFLEKRCPTWEGR